MDLKLATDAALLVNFDGLLEFGRMLTRLPCSSVLYKVAAEATSLNCEGVCASFDATLVGTLLDAGVLPSALNSVTPAFDFSPNFGTNLRCAESSF